MKRLYYAAFYAARAFEKRQNSDYDDFATSDPAHAQDLSRAVHAFVHAYGELLRRLVPAA